eukprot:1900029-Pyramimonas_sp.AAC.2
MNAYATMHASQATCLRNSFSRTSPRLRAQRAVRTTVVYTSESRDENVVSSEQRRTHELGATLLARRNLVLSSCGLSLGAIVPSVDGNTTNHGAALAACVDMPALQGKGFCKPQTIYPDYTLTETGLQFKDIRIGAGSKPVKGDRVVIDWDGTHVLNPLRCSCHVPWYLSLVRLVKPATWFLPQRAIGYTVGYFGRIIQAKNLSKGARKSIDLTASMVRVLREPIAEGEREYIRSGHQSRKGRENIRTTARPPWRESEAVARPRNPNGPPYDDMRRVMIRRVTVCDICVTLTWQAHQA